MAPLIDCNCDYIKMRICITRNTYYYSLAVNPRVARDNYFYGGFIKKKIYNLN